MDIKEYETRKSASRHIEVKLLCESCGAEFWAKWSRVKIGQGRFCSLICANKSQLEKAREKRGKENARMWFDETTGIMRALWREEDGKPNTTTYAHWLWEKTYGEVPDGHKVRWKDGDHRNCIVENLELVTPEMFSKAVSDRLMGHIHSEETRKKIAIAHTGQSKWSGFVYDDRYPGFSKWLKKKIKERDNYTCQICKKNLWKQKNSRIHHIDGDKKNPSEDNLILLCTVCHAAIHSKMPANPVILAFRSALRVV